MSQGQHGAGQISKTLILVSKRKLKKYLFFGKKNHSISKIIANLRNIPVKVCVLTVLF